MSQQKIYGTVRWRLIRCFILERDGYRCVRCGKAGRLEIDHIIPLHKGCDPWVRDNLQALCRGCHFEKTAGENANSDPRDPAWLALVDGA